MNAIVPQQERDEFTLRLQQAVASFIDDPRASVAEPDVVLEDTSARLVELLTERRDAIRAHWKGDGEATTPGTEELRTALREYRDILERLLRC